RSVKYLMSVDESLRKFSQCWQLIYLEFKRIRTIDIDNHIYLASSIYLEIYYSILLFRDFNTLYTHKNKYDSSYFPMLLYECFNRNLYNRHLGYFIAAGILDKKLDFETIWYDGTINTLDTITLTFILHGNPNFEYDPRNIEHLSLQFREFLRNSDSDLDFISIYKDLIEDLKKK